MLYLYYKWERYLTELDKSNKRIRDSVIEMLSELNRMKARREDIEQIFPTSFTHKKLVSDWKGIGEDLWPNLNAVLPIPKTDTNGRMKDFPNKSSRIFREAMYYLSKLQWVYTSDISYGNILRKQFWMESNDDGVASLFLVPEFFVQKNLETCLAFEQCQDEKIWLLQRKL